MDLLNHFRRQLEYNHWANREVLVALQNLSQPLAASEKLLAHVISGELLWLARTEQVPPQFAVWPVLSLQQCEEQIHKSYRSYVDYFRRELPADFERKVSYKNSKGESWASRVDDILTHVFTHSAYHRGQIALQMRQAGQTPAYTDFIHSIRKGLIK
jgi:uncharacterized damage-inducible protein DinB